MLRHEANPSAPSELTAPVDARVSDQVGQAVLVAATLTMFLIPMLSGIGGRLAKKAAAPLHEAPDLVGLQSEEPAGRVLDWGRQGRCRALNHRCLRGPFRLHPGLAWSVWAH